MLTGYLRPNKSKQQPTRELNNMYHSIIEQLSNGVSVRKTAAALGCNPSTVMRAKKRWELAKLGAGIA